MIRAYFRKGQHRMWRYSCISVTDLLNGYVWYFPTFGVVELRSWMSVESVLASQKRGDFMVSAEVAAVEMVA